MYQCSCAENNFEMDTVLQNCQKKSISEISTNFYEPNSVTNNSRAQSLHSNSYEISSTCMFPTVLVDISINQHELPIDLNLSNKEINMGHLNIQGICGEKLGHFFRITSFAYLTPKEQCTCFWKKQIEIKGSYINQCFQN